MWCEIQNNREEREQRLTKKKVSGTENKTILSQKWRMQNGKIKPTMTAKSL